jgi:osmotically-inducible protein OsmY
VSLSGFVTGDKIKRRAVEVAKSVGGVKSVVDAMYVKP